MISRVTTTEGRRDPQADKALDVGADSIRALNIERGRMSQMRGANDSPSENRLRILILAPFSNPDGITGPLIGYLHSEALARLHSVTLVIRGNDEQAFRRKQASFHQIEAVRLPWLDAIYAWTLRCIFKYNYRSQVLTAFSYFFSVAIEWRAWRQTRRRIFAGEFDVVLRLLPISYVLPSPFAFFLRKGPIPFVVGPINGGLPWPRGFSQADKQKQWISNLKDFYRFLPFAKSTYCNAAAIIAGSSQTYAEFSGYRDKLFFVQGENGITAPLLTNDIRSPERRERLELVFVGGLVPYKGCDIALRAAAPLLRMDRAHFSIVGDGTERGRLEQLTRSLRIEKAVSFYGMLSHKETMRRLAASDVLVFPSVREFGGAVVFEALAMGAVPVVVDFGGPGDVVHPEIGFKVPLTNENDVVARIEEILADIFRDPSILKPLQQRGMRYARENLSWEAKAEVVTRILCWVLRRGPKPDLKPPQVFGSD